MTELKIDTASAPTKIVAIPFRGLEIPGWYIFDNLEGKEGPYPKSTNLDELKLHFMHHYPCHTGSGNTGRLVWIDQVFSAGNIAYEQFQKEHKIQIVEQEKATMSQLNSRMSLIRTMTSNGWLPRNLAEGKCTLMPHPSLKRFQVACRWPNLYEDYVCKVPLTESVQLDQKSVMFLPKRWDETVERDNYQFQKQGEFAVRIKKLEHLGWKVVPMTQSVTKVAKFEMFTLAPPDSIKDFAPWNKAQTDTQMGDFMVGQGDRVFSFPTWWKYVVDEYLQKFA